MLNKSPESIDQQLADDAREAAECEAAEIDDLRKLAIRGYVERAGLIEPINSADAA